MSVYATVKVRKERPFVVSRRFFRPAETCSGVRGQSAAADVGVQGGTAKSVDYAEGLV